MFKKLVSTILLGTVAAVAYYVYKNRDGAEDKTDDDKVVHFIEDKIDSPVAADAGTAVEKPKRKTKTQTEKS